MKEASPIGWAQVPLQRQVHIEAGVKALGRIDKKRDFHDWYLVGLALYHLRETAREQSGANSGGGYNEARRQCIRDNPKLRPLDEIDDAATANAIWLVENWDAVSKWHEERLPLHNRRQVSHPTAVKYRYGLDHPELVKHRAKADKPDLDAPDAEAEDAEDNEEVEDAEEVFDFDVLARPTFAAEMEPIDDIPTREELIARWHALWLIMPDDVRHEVTNFGLQWQKDTAEFAAMHQPDKVMEEAVMHETKRAINKSAGAKVRALGRKKQMIVSTGFPTQERLADSIHAAENTPLAEGEDPMPASDDLGPITRH